MRDRSALVMMVFAAWLGTAAMAGAQEVQPRVKTPPAPTVAPRGAPEEHTAQKPPATTSAVVLAGIDELNKANNACGLQARVTRPIDNEPFQTF